MEQKTAKWMINIATALCVLGLIVMCIYGIRSGLFTNRAAMEQFVKISGIWGPVIFILLQIVQVVVPVIPGAISCVAGVVIFGPWAGLLYNYIGIVVGAAINFYLARRYGQRIVRFFVKECTYNKYANWLDKGKKFDKFFALAILFPCAPDDVLCMLAGLTKMSWKKFSAVLLLGKPASIAAYSVAAVYAGGYLGSMVG